MARSFNGSTQYIAVVDNASLRLTGNNWSIAIRCKPNSLHDYGNLLTKLGALNGWGVITFANGNWQFQLGASGTADTAAGAGSLVNGNEYRLMITYDGTNYRLYQDGTLKTTAAHGAVTSDTASFYVGADFTNSRYWNGNISEVALWNNATLTGTDATDYANGKLPSQLSAVPTSYWPTWGITLPEPDLSGNGITLASGGADPPYAAHPTDVVLYLVQVTTLSHTNSNTTLSASFTNLPVVGNYVIARYWGQDTSLLGSPTITDNQTGNSYDPSYYLQDTLLNGGEFVGEALAKVVGASGTFTVTATIAIAGRIDLVLEEWHASPALELDRVSINSGNSTSPSPGSVTTTQGLEVLSTTCASVETSNPGTVTVPSSGYVIDQTELNGSVTGYTVGGGAYRTAGATISTNPTWTIDTSSHWVCGQATYKVSSAPEWIPDRLIISQSVKRAGYY